MPRALSLWFVGIILSIFLPAHARADDAKLIPESVHPCDAPCARMAVIFFHGITGSRATWFNAPTQFYWPSALGEDPLLADKLDVYRVDYTSTTWSGPSFNDIGSSVALAIDPLMIQRRYSKVVLIGHSLGGIVAEAYMIHVKLRYGHQALSRFPILITLGTPFLGSSLASLAQLVATNPQLRILVPISQNDLQQYVNRAWTDVAGKHLACAQQRNSGVAGLINYAAYEGSPTPGIGIVVSQQSATLHATTAVQIDRTHIGLPKPADRSDQLYAWVRDALLKCGNNTICFAPGPACPTGDFPDPPH
jgi:pimeloyl-ACP methyl ester carboxylesterase